MEIVVILTLKRMGHQGGDDDCVKEQALYQYSNLAKLLGMVTQAITLLLLERDLSP